MTRIRALVLTVVLFGAAVPARAMQGAETGHLDIARFLLILAVALVAGKLSGALFERIGQPAVLGELIAGAILGVSLLNVVPTDVTDALTEPFSLFAEIGVLVLLFEIGLETDLRQMFRVGPAAATVAVVGVVLPFVLGFLFWISPLVPDSMHTVAVFTTAIYIGAALTATSVGITARVLTDLKVMSSIEAKMIIGAAVIDDVFGLILLGLVSTLAAGAAVTLLDIGTAAGIAIGFLVLAIVMGIRIAPRLFNVVDKMNARGVLLVAAFSFMLIVAGLADLAGSAMIIGAFAAGLILSRTNQFDTIESQIKPVSDIFAPIFFISIGARLDLGLLNPFGEGNLSVLGIGLGLFVIAVVGKVLSGWAVWWRGFNRPAVGIGMMPRGEVGLIFAQIGVTSGVLNDELFGAIILMVIGTTFIAPFLLKWAFNRWGTH
jgi:Kef-type K+ transport system membrane component KefB